MSKKVALLFCFMIPLQSFAFEVILEGAPTERAQGRLCLVNPLAPLLASACSESVDFEEGQAVFDLSQASVLKDALAPSGQLLERSLMAQLKNQQWRTCFIEAHESEWPRTTAYWPSDAISSSLVERIRLKIVGSSWGSAICEVSFETPGARTLALMDVARVGEACGYVASHAAAGNVYERYQGYQPPDRALVAGSFNSESQFVFEEIWVQGQKFSAAEFCRDRVFASEPLVEVLAKAERKAEPEAAQAISTKRRVMASGGILLGFSAYHCLRREMPIWAGLAAVQSAVYWQGSVENTLPRVKQRQHHSDSGVPDVLLSQEHYHALQATLWSATKKTVASVVASLPWAVFLNWQLATGRLHFGLMRSE